MVDQKIGFVGIGRMGKRMVQRLMQAGHHVTVYDTNQEAVKSLAGMGAHPADSPAAVASAAPVVFASLPTPSIVEAVALGPRGVVEGSQVKVFVDVSTTGAIYAKKVAAGLAAKGITAVDAPVSGGMAGAERGTIAIMVACPKPVFDEIKPLLEILGKPFFVGTKPGQGQTMKLLNNLLSATAMAVSSEALAMGVKAGLDPTQMMDVFNAGSGRNSATHDKIKQYVIPRTFNFGFTLGLVNKDVRLCLEEAEAAGVPMIVGAAVKQFLSIAAATEGADADMTAMTKSVEKWSGVRIGSEQP
jgi:3-hydroxyisobutyrate dehydrogenase-like beta-hydroxyacid dehydrogenase